MYDEAKAKRAVNFFNSLKGFQGSKLPDFARLANGISKLSNINYNEILTAGQSLRQIASQLQSLGGIKLDDNVVQIANVANAMSKLGGKSIVNATNNVPLLANALNQLMVTLSKAPTVNQSVIDMTNALANLAAQGSKVGSASKSVVNGLNRTNAAAKRASGSTMSLARAFGKFYANYFLLVRGFKGMFNMMESAMELTETVNYFEVTLRNIGESALEDWNGIGKESAEEYSKSFAKQLRENTEMLTGLTISETGKIGESIYSGLGLNPAMVTQYSAMFAQVASSIGMTEQASVDLSKAFVRLGADWASLRNVDFEVAYEKLGSALAGQSRSLRAFGVDITMASLQSIAFANGIEKSVSEMTQSEKAYLRLIAIIQQSKVAWGDLANTLDQPANMMRVLKQNIEVVSVLIGQVFLPIIQKALPIINGFTIAIRRMLIALLETMGVNTKDIINSTNGLDEQFGDMSDGIDEATESAEKFNRATRGWDELNVLGKDTSKGYGVGNDIVENAQLMEAYNNAIDEYDKAWREAYERMNNEAEAFADKIFEKLNIWDKDNLYKGAENFGKNIAEFLNNTITVENFRKVGDTVGTTISAVVKAALAFEETFDFSEAVTAVAEGINALFESIEGKDIAEGIDKFVDEIEKGLLDGIKSINYKSIKSDIVGFLKEIDIDTILIIIGAFTLKSKTGVGLGTLFKNALKGALLGVAGGLAGIGKEIAVDLKTVGVTVGKLNLLSNLSNTPSFVTVASDIVSKIEDGLAEIMPDWSKRLFGNIIAGISIGGVGGSFLPGAGTAAGAIIGAITGAIATIKIDLGSILSNVFTFEKTEHFASISQKAFEDAEQAFNDRDWGSLGVNILKSLGSGLLMFPSVLFEPIWNIGEFIFGNIKSVLGFKGSDSHKFAWFGENAIKSLAKSFTLTSIGDSISDWYENKVKPLFSSEKWQFSGIKEGFEKTFNSAFDAIKGIWNGFAKFINNALELDFDGFTKKFNVFGKKIEVGLPAFTVTLGKLPTFQTGGFPEDGLVMANHNELVGKFSNGKTAVANNDQITKGIEEAAYRGMMRALNQSQGKNSDVNVYLQGDAAGIFKLVQNENSRMKKVTGRSLLA